VLLPSAPLTLPPAPVNVCSQAIRSSLESVGGRDSFKFKFDYLNMDLIV
jgi:hypothetical protein